MREHTPKPWVARRSTSQDMGMAYITIYHYGLSVATMNMRHYPTAEADARFITAAPDMFDAVEHFVSCTDAPCNTCYELAGAALAKARGE